MRVIDSDLTETDITHLLGLRTAMVRRAPPPGVPMDSALRLGSQNYVRSNGRGGVEITETGVSHLKGWFLFCEAVGCDGVLRHWKLLSPMHAGKDPRDPPLEHERIDERSRLVIACPKCAHRNVLEGDQSPTRGSEYVIVEVLHPKALRRNSQ